MAPLYSISTTEPRGPNPSIICTHTHRTVRSLEALAGYQIRASQSSLPQCSSEAAPYPNHPHANEHTSLSLQVKTRSNKHCREKKAAAIIQDSEESANLVQQINGIGGPSGVVFLAFQEKGVFCQFRLGAVRACLFCWSRACCFSCWRQAITHIRSGSSKA